MAKRNRKSSSRPAHPAESPPIAAPPRIIGGSLRGRKLAYLGHERTRPMKERVRESVFNLIGAEVPGKYAIDLFAGTGALGLEAISRGAAHALLIERHFPTADLIEQNAASLGVAEHCTVFAGDTFHWWQAAPALPAVPWVVFCSPPYALYIEDQRRMLDLIEQLLAAAPLESVFVVEADDRFDMGQLPLAAAWDVRDYPPAFVAVLRKQ